MELPHPLQVKLLRPCQSQAKDKYEELAAMTAESLIATAGIRCRVSEAVMTYLTRANELRMSSDEARDLLGISEDCVLDRASLSPDLEDAVIEEYAQLERLVLFRPHIIR